MRFLRRACTRTQGSRKQCPSSHAECHTVASRPATILPTPFPAHQCIASRSWKPLLMTAAWVGVCWRICKILGTPPPYLFLGSLALASCHVLPAAPGTTDERWSLSADSVAVSRRGQTGAPAVYYCRRIGDWSLTPEFGALM